MSKIQENRKASITITFERPRDAAAWMELALERNVLSDASGLFQKDGLDGLVGDTGVPGSNEFIVRRASDRPYGKITTETLTTVSAT